MRARGHARNDITGFVWPVRPFYSQCTGDIASVFMEIARYISHRRAGTTAHLEHADIAIGLGGTIAYDGRRNLRRIPSARFGIG